jgi:hypothetical protein
MALKSPPPRITVLSRVLPKIGKRTLLESLNARKRLLTND